MTEQVRARSGWRCGRWGGAKVARSIIKLLRITSQRFLRPKRHVLMNKRNVQFYKTEISFSGFCQWLEQEFKNKTMISKCSSCDSSQGNSVWFGAYCHVSDVYKPVIKICPKWSNHTWTAVAAGIYAFYQCAQNVPWVTMTDHKAKWIAHYMLSIWFTATLKTVFDLLIGRRRLWTRCLFHLASQLNVVLPDCLWISASANSFSFFSLVTL